MGFEETLEKNKQAILEQWFELIVATYPKNTQKFLLKKTDPFANPIRHTLSTGIAELFSVLVHGSPKETESTLPVLDKILKLLAVQEFTPGEAVRFVFLSKEAIEKALENQLRDQETLADFLRFGKRIDELALLAFDAYTRCREKTYELRVFEVKNQYSRLLEQRYPGSFRHQDKDGPNQHDNTNQGGCR